MKVRELIELLQKEDPETIIHMSNWCGGCTPLRPEDFYWQPIKYPVGYIFNDPPNWGITSRQGPQWQVFAIHNGE